MFEFNLIRFLVEIRELKIQSVEWKTHTTLTENKKIKSNHYKSFLFYFKFLLLDGCCCGISLKIMLCDKLESILIKSIV